MSTFEYYRILSKTIPDYQQRVALLRALVAMHVNNPSTLRLLGAI